MQKILGIIRHGKSTKDFSSVEDLDRPLKEIGIIKSIDIAEKIREQNFIPDLIVSSPAIRALHTAMIAARVFGYPYNNILIDPVIYSDEEKNIVQFIKTTGDTINNLFIFGHNPVLTSLANFYLSQHTDLPTSGAIILQFDISHWSEVSKKTVRKEHAFLY
jgi:phosphohistidine phosphatase